jgi:hypothetical protein
MAVSLRVLAGRRQLAISRASFLPGSAELSDGAVVSVSYRLSVGVVGGYLLVVLRHRRAQAARMRIAGRGYKAGRFTDV